VKRNLAVLVVVLTVLASAGAGVGAWLALRDHGAQAPQISVYSNRHLVRVGPYFTCEVLDLTDCQTPKDQGELPVTERGVVQLGVPEAIGAAPWRLLEVYQDGETARTFRSGSRLAVTIPTVDPHLGRLNGIAVQLLTVIALPDGQLASAAHAEWSVAMVWPDAVTP